MSESEIPIENDTVPPPPRAESPAPPPRRASWGWLLLLAVIVVAAVLGWRQWQRLQQSETQVAAWSDTAALLEQRIDDLQLALDGLRRGQKAIETRASDNAATNQVLREELLGMGERASLLEDAVARLADNRVRGEVILRLNEAEFLLLLGEERLRLFGDVPAAVQAFTLADAALAGVDDPSLATLRQTLAQELLALRRIDADPRPMLRAELARLSDGLAALPATRDGDVLQTTQSDSRLVQLLSQLVTVRRVDARDAVLGPVQRETTLAALRLQLELAQAGLARPDPAAYQHALTQSGALIARLFDPADAQVVQAQATLDRLRAATLVPELPVLGATLQELRGLRSTRSLGSLPSSAPLEVEYTPDAADLDRGEATDGDAAAAEPPSAAATEALAPAAASEADAEPGVPADPSEDDE